MNIFEKILDVPLGVYVLIGLGLIFIAPAFWAVLFVQSDGLSVDTDNIEELLGSICSLINNGVSQFLWETERFILTCRSG